MTIIAKETSVVHMIVRTGKPRGPETLLCGEDIVTATPNDAGDVVAYEVENERFVETGLAEGAKLGTRLTGDPGDVTCKTCERLLKETP